MTLETGRSPATTLGSLPALLGLVVLLRLLLALWVWSASGPSGFIGADTSSYVAPAESLLHGSFSSYDGQPEIFRTPGYPILLLPAVISDHFATAVFLENLILSLASAWLVFLITRNISPGFSAGKWAIALYAFEFLGLLYSVKALSETLFCTQILFFAWLFLRFLKRPAFTTLVLSAVALSWATYTRPVGLYLGPILVPLLVFMPRNLPLKKRVLNALVFPMVLALTLAPWFSRNSSVAGYRGFSAAGDYVLYFYTAASVQAHLEHKGLLQMQEELGFGGLPYVKNDVYLRTHPEQQTSSPGQIVRYWHSETNRIFREHPLSFVVVHLRGSVTLLLDPGATELLKTLGAYPDRGGLMARSIDHGFVAAAIWLIRQYPWVVPALLIAGFQMIAYATLSIAGLFRMPRDAMVFLVVLVSYLVLASGGPAATGRYRTPVMPFVCVAAGVAIQAWRERKVLKSSNTAASV